MIPPKVKDDWLVRELNNFEEVKTFTSEDIWEDINALSPKPVFHGKDKPWLHQLVCFLLGVHNPYFLNFIDMGMGKSRIVLDILSYEKLSGKLTKAALIVVPNITNIDSWADEAKLFAPTLKVVPLYGGSKERFNTLDTVNDADVYIINSAGLVAMFSTKANRKLKIKSRPDTAFIQKYAPMFQAFVCDESELVKNIHSLIYQISLIFSVKCLWRFGLTGTPMNKEPEDFWAQFFVADRGETLGTTLTFFRDVFYDKKPGRFKMFDYVFKKKLKKDFNRIIQNRSITYAIEDALDMPKRLYVKRKVDASAEAMKYYDRIVDQIIKAKKDYTLMKSSYTRLRQISSGYVTFKNEETGERQFIEFAHNPKLEELVHLINTIPDNRKIIIVHHFVRSGKIISDRLTAEKRPHLRLWSGQKEKKETIRRFRYENKEKILLMNYQSGGRGLNLQVGNYLIFYESPDSASMRTQTERRIWRGGQNRKCFFYDLVTKGTKDEAILASNAAGRSLLEDLTKGKVSWR